MSREFDICCGSIILYIWPPVNYLEGVYTLKVMLTNGVSMSLSIMSLCIIQ